MLLGLLPDVVLKASTGILNLKVYYILQRKYFEKNLNKTQEFIFAYTCVPAACKRNVALCVCVNCFKKLILNACIESHLVAVVENSNQTGLRKALICWH